MDFPKDASFRSVFVSNIPYEASEQKLKEILSEVGHVVSFRMIMDSETLKPKGFAFCEYEDSEIANSAIRNLNGREIFGRNLRVAPASTNEVRGGKPAGPVLASESSSFGPSIHPENAPEEITKAVNSIPTEQMFELMKQMKLYVQQQPEEARQLLLHNPQLAYALLQAQVIMRIVDPHQANDFLHKPRQPAAVINPFPEFVEHPPNFEMMRQHDAYHTQQIPRNQLPQHDPQADRGPPLGLGPPPVPMNVGGPDQDPMSFPHGKMATMNPYMPNQSNFPPSASRDPGGGDLPHIRPQDPRTIQDVKGPPPHDKQLFSPADYPRMPGPQEGLLLHRPGMGMDTSQPLPPANLPHQNPMMGSDPRMAGPPSAPFGPHGNLRMETPHDPRRMYNELDRGRNPQADVSPRLPPNFGPHGPIQLTESKQSLPVTPATETASAISARSQEEKTSLIRQVLMLSDEQIAQCTPEQRQSIILLKEHFAKQTGGAVQGRN